VFNEYDCAGVTTLHALCAIIVWIGRLRDD
jgi:hypothetical protein